MSMLVFFPWVTIKNPISYGSFELSPYEIGTPNPHNIPLVIDTIIAPYKENAQRSISQCTVLNIQGKEFDAQLSDEEIAEIFNFREIFSFAALSDRTYFSFSSTRYNHDTFRAVIQGYNKNSSGVAIRSRKKDGTIKNYVPAQYYAVICPTHVHPENNVEFDKVFVEALLKTGPSVDAERFEWSIFYFNRANTDSEQITEQAELVFTSGAFEALFSLKGGKESELVSAFTNCLGRCLVEDNAFLRSERICNHQRFSTSSSIRTCWIQDLFRLRGNLAHGAKVSSYRSLWSIQEHLILAAWVFPLVVKSELEKNGLYTMTDDDHFKIFVFDRLIRSNDLFDPIIQPDDEDSKWVWNEVMSDAVWDWLKKKILK